MRTRALILVAAVACFSQAVPVGAARTRRAMLPYEITDPGFNVGAPMHEGFGAYDEGGAYVFRLRRGERFVSVTVLDDTERPVAGIVVQRQTDSHVGAASIGHAVTFENFCGATERPVEVVPDVDVEILLQRGTCQDGTPSMPTTGDVVVDFHRR